MGGEAHAHEAERPPASQRYACARGGGGPRRRRGAHAQSRAGARRRPPVAAGAAGLPGAWGVPGGGVPTPHRSLGRSSAGPERVAAGEKWQKKARGRGSGRPSLPAGRARPGPGPRRAVLTSARVQRGSAACGHLY